MYCFCFHYDDYDIRWFNDVKEENNNNGNNGNPIDFVAKRLCY